MPERLPTQVDPDEIRHVVGLPSMLSDLQGRTTVPELFGTAADLARVAGDDARAVVLTVVGGRLSAQDCGVLEHEESDLLRRRLLGAPPRIVATSREGRWLRLGTRHASTDEAPSTFDDPRLELGHTTVGPIAPDGDLLAVVLVCRPDAPSVLAETATHTIAAMTGVALARLVLTARLNEATTVLRHLSVSAEALIQEATNAPIVVPAEGAHGPMFLGSLSAEPPPLPADLEQLTTRESEVAALLVDGRTDRQIADTLVISVNTAKDHVARVRRKLKSANRAEAAARYVRLVQGR